MSPRSLLGAMSPFGRFLVAMLALDFLGMVLAAGLATVAPVPAKTAIGAALLASPAVAYWLVFRRHAGRARADRTE